MLLVQKLAKYLNLKISSATAYFVLSYNTRAFEKHLLFNLHLIFFFENHYPYGNFIALCTIFFFKFRA